MIWCARGLPRGSETRRDRVSKLLLRQGLVYFSGKAWIGRHETWLRALRFDNPALQLSYEATFDATLAFLDRRQSSR